jgi:hypothetical protein
MKNLLFGFVFLTFSNFAIADHHALNLEARQPRAEMTITSIDLGEDLTVITAEGDMDGYGKVYVRRIGWVLFRSRTRLYR